MKVSNTMNPELSAKSRKWSITKITQNKRLFISLATVCSLAVAFWLGSRYPQLNEKAQMGGQTQTMGLSFDFVHIILMEDSYTAKIISNTLNWIETNKKGMIFGMLFAAALILVFHELRDKVSENRWKNAGIGMIIGAPLGVCVNCATPIAQGIKNSGGKSETALATLMSSPTLNFIVLGMLFSLVPLYLALTKLVLSFLFIVVGIPLILKLFPVEEDQKMQRKLTTAEAEALTPMGISLSYTSDHSWWGSLQWVFKNYFKALWYISVRTLPFMLLAGILGNILVTFFPLENILQILNLDLDSSIKMFGALFLLAVVCTFFPVPMAFDVIITVILIAGGLPMKFAGVVLFTLGIFSIYPYIIVSRVISYRVATTVFVAICGLGVVAGTTAHLIDKKLWVDRLATEFSQFDPNIPALTKRHDVEFKNQDDIVRAIIPVNYEPTQNTSGLEVSRSKFTPTPSGASNTPFKKLNGSTLGLDLPYEYSVSQLVEHQTHQQSTAAVDLNKDNWVDLALTTDKTVFLFLNNSGKSFVEYQRIQSDSLEFHGVSVADLNNDGWMDLFLNTYQKGSFYILNQEGTFPEAALTKVDLPKDPTYTLSCSFADLDMNGYLDVFMGNWSVGFIGNGYYEDSKNYLVMNVASDSSQLMPLSEIDGETLTSVFTDFNMDGALDLIVGNDYAAPDVYYLGTKPFNGFSMVQRSDSIIPVTTTFSMSSVTADINNDLIPEIYSIQFGGTIERENRVENELSICSGIKDEKKRKACQAFVHRNLLYVESYQKRNLDLCPEEDRQGCYAAAFGNHYTKAVYTDAGLSPLQIVDTYDSEPFKYFKAEMEYYQPSSYQLPDHIAQEMLPQKPFGAVLLMKDHSEAPYEDVSEDWNIPYTGWSWNAKMADLNNDEYLDIYVSNGFNNYEFVSSASNIYYENVEGRTYADKTHEAGLSDLLPTHSYVYLDYNNDGHLDIITNPQIGGEMMVYENQGHSENQAIAFEITDEVGDYGALGAKVYLRYGENGEKAQMREVQSGGGFKSFDQPIVHFGMGHYASASRLEIHWSTGEKTILDQPFESGYRYKIVRKRAHWDPIRRTH